LQRKRSVVDANVILRYLLKDDQKLYQAAQEFFGEVFTGKRMALVLQSVVDEVVYVLLKVYQIPKTDVAEVLTEFLAAKGLKVQDESLTLEALRLFSEKNLDFVDGLLCAYGREWEVISFDKGVMKCLEMAEN